MWAMDQQDAAGFIALCWLIGAFLLMARSVQRGRALADQLALRHAETYEALGRPRPGYLYSARRDRFAQFVARREYEDLDDPVLSAEFDAYRRAEARLVISIIASMVVVAGLALLVS